MTNHSQLVEAAKAVVAADREGLKMGSLASDSEYERMYDALDNLAAALEASPEGERGDVAAEKLDVLHLCVLAEALTNEYMREAPDNVSLTTRRLNVEQILTLTRRLNPPAAQPAINIVQSEHVPRGEAFAVSVNGTDENGDPKISAAKITNLAAQPDDWQPKELCDSEIPPEEPDEKVCGTCGGEKVVETFVRREGSTFYDPCPDCNPTPEGPKPTGTIFELDLYAREGLARLADQYESATETVTIPRRQVINLIRDISDELKVRIDNCMKQYGVPEGHAAVYLPVEDVAGIAHTGFKEDCPDSEDLERFGTLYKACRQALSNGEQK